MSVEGKVVLITGASRGLGRAAAEAFLRAGAHVLATGRDPRAMDEAGAALQEIGGAFQVLKLEVTDEKAVIDLISSLDRLDVLINNAGVARFNAFLETDTEELRHVFDTNVIGAFVVMREAARKMAVQGSGAIINIASDGALRGLACMAPYAASKHALLGMSRSARLEMRRYGVQITTVCPGPINTEILGSGSDKAIDPAELAKTLVHIASLEPGMEIQELLIQPTQIEMPT